MLLISTKHASLTTKEKDSGHTFRLMVSGEWKDNKRNGSGKEKWPGGGIYEGECRGGANHDYIPLIDGVLFICTTDPSSTTKKEGFGTYFWLSGVKYEGEWKDDKQNGKGKMKWPDGDIHEGEC